MPWQKLLESIGRLGDLLEMNEQERYDVFLSHNSQDKRQVQIIANRLKESGLKLWLDEQQIDAGDSIPQKVKHAMHNSKSVAIFIGENGLGGHQRGELETFEMLQGNGENLTIIPVLLPGVDKLPDEADYLFCKRDLYTLISFENYPEALEKLVQSIRKWLLIWTRNELKRLVKEKEKAERRLEQIEQEIKQINSQLKVESAQREEALNWLLLVKDIIEKYAKKVLQRLPNLDLLVRERSGGFEEFCVDLETCVEFIYYAFKTQDICFLDRISIDFSLANSELYKENADSIAYETAIDLIMESIHSECFDEETTQDLKRYLKFFKERLLIFA